MLSFSIILLAITLIAYPTQARFHWLEHRALNPRRFGQEHPPVIDKLSAACEGQVCGNLAGQAITPLLAAQPACSQQQMADAIIDASKQFDAATQANMIALAKEYRQAEKNTPPDFTTNPPRLRNSVFCDQAPKNAELNGLVQAQDPANDPNLFFDPASGKTVTLGSQANTFPFGSKGAAAPAPASAAASTAPAAKTNGAAASQCPAPVTVTVIAATKTATPAAKTTTPCPKPKTFTVTASRATAAAAVTTAASAPAASGANLQKFSGALGGVTPPPVTALGGGNFQVTGNAQFNNFQNALVRSCDVQHNQCANKANATGNKGALTVDACGKQQDTCNALARSTAP